MLTLDQKPYHHVACAQLAPHPHEACATILYDSVSLQHGLYYRCSAPLFVGGLGLGVDLQEALDVYLEQEVPLG